MPPLDHHYPPAHTPSTRRVVSKSRKQQPGGGAASVAGGEVEYVYEWAEGATAEVSQAEIKAFTDEVGRCFCCAPLCAVGADRHLCCGKLACMSAKHTGGSGAPAAPTPSIPLLWHVRTRSCTCL